MGVVDDGVYGETGVGFPDERGEGRDGVAGRAVTAVDEECGISDDEKNEWDTEGSYFVDVLGIAVGEEDTDSDDAEWISWCSSWLEQELLHISFSQKLRLNRNRTEG